MQFIRFDGDRLGLRTDDGREIVDLTDRLDLTGDDPLLEYIRGDGDAARYADEPSDVAVEAVRLEPPIRRPGKVVAAPSNYPAHQAEMSGGPTTPPSGYFLKAPSSIVGPADTIELPFSDRRFDHEIELAFLMADDVRDVSVEEALDAVFGYTMLLDISMRGEEDRSESKSFDSFTPVGPAVVTPDEVGDPQDLRLTLEVDGEVRQDSTTAEMTLSCAEFVAVASTHTTLHAGDVVTTGTPSGVARLAGGDVITAHVEAVGSMTLPVEEHSQRYDETAMGRLTSAG